MAIQVDEEAAVVGCYVAVLEGVVPACCHRVCCLFGGETVVDPGGASHVGWEIYLVMAVAEYVDKVSF